MSVRDRILGIYRGPHYTVQTKCWWSRSERQAARWALAVAEHQNESVTKATLTAALVGTGSIKINWEAPS